MSSRFYIWPRYALEYGYRRIEFGPTAGSIMARLYAANGDRVSCDDLIETAYFDREDGGPDYALTTVITTIHHLRRHLISVPISIINEMRQGYRLVGSDHIALMFPLLEPYPEETRHGGPYKYTKEHLLPPAIPFVAAH